ncbi:MAG TPA: hypothetical protein VH186_31180 [Chloroflexia bacterium]|nr:hypothetical protein [Chloroflexia bacterium]
MQNSERLSVFFISLDKVTFVTKKGFLAMLLGSDILEVAIGLFFIYFIGSIFASAANEFISQILSQRAKQLEMAICEMLGDKALAQRVLQNPMIVSLNSKTRTRFPKLFGWLSSYNVPSYVPAQFFSSSLLHELQKMSLTYSAEPYRAKLRQIASDSDLPDELTNTLDSLLDTQTAFFFSLELTGNFLSAFSEQLNLYPPEVRQTLKPLATSLLPDGNTALNAALNSLKTIIEGSLGKDSSPAQNLQKLLDAAYMGEVNNPKVIESVKALKESLKGQNLSKLLAPLQQAIRQYQPGPYNFPKVAADKLKGALIQLPDNLVAQEVKGALISTIDKFIQSPDLYNGGQDAASAVTAALKLVDIPQDLKQILLGFLNNQQRNAANLQGQIEKWFDDKMDRVSGAYKRWTRTWLLIIGLLIALALNLDTVNIATSLWSNGALRHSLADQATAQVVSLSQNSSGATSGQTTPALSNPQQQVAQYKAILDDQQQAGLPITWSGDPLFAPVAIDPNDNTGKDGKALAGFCATQPEKCKQAGIVDVLGGRFWQLLLKLLGLLITALAFTQGAPFWFDVLNRVTNLRSSGGKPATASESADTQKIDVQATVAPLPSPVQPATTANQGVTPLG